MAKDFLKNTGGNDDPFAGGMSLEDADAILYGGVDVPDSGRVVAKPIALSEVWANPAQPRRAVPNSLALYWYGNPVEVKDLLARWHTVASDKSGQAIDIYAVLQGQGQGFDLDDAPAVFVEYVALLRLAASIHTDGLINPITVIKQSDRYLLESGERRWLAYNLLHQYMGDAYAKVPAVKSDGDNYIWRQATENTQRRSLNAIGMARQLALLIMEARRGIDGQTYDDFNHMSPRGTCDRRFYAQIANGNVHKIPRGMGEKIQGAMDLSMTQLSRYRSLLKLTDDDSVNDALWIRADVEDWAENHLRRVSNLPLDVLKEALNQDNWTLDDLFSLEDVKVETPDRLPYGNLQTESTLPYGKVEDDATPSPIVPTVPVRERSWVGLEVNFTRDDKNGVVVSEHGPDLIKVKFVDGVSTVVGRNQVTLVSSDKASSKTLNDYYESPAPASSHTPSQAKDEGMARQAPTGEREQDVPRDSFGREQVVRSDATPFGKSVNGLTDHDEILTDYWDGVLAAVATMAAIRGQANVVGRIQRLRSMTRAKAHNMDGAELHSLFDKLYSDISGLLADVMGEYGEMLESLYTDLVGDDDE